MAVHYKGRVRCFIESVESVQELRKSSRLPSVRERRNRGWYYRDISCARPKENVGLMTRVAGADRPEISFRENA